MVPQFRAYLPHSGYSLCDRAGSSHSQEQRSLPEPVPRERPASPHTQAIPIMGLRCFSAVRMSCW